MTNDPHINRIIQVALEVKELREKLAQKEAELAHISNATTTRGAPPPPAAPVTTTPPTVTSGHRDRIRALMANGKPWSTEEIAKRLGLPREVVGDTMKRMGDLKRMRPGIYRLKSG